MTAIQLRQGDVLLARIGGTDALPKDAKAVTRDKGRVVLAYGEVTGHAHAIMEPNAELFTNGRERWLVIRPAELHEHTALFKEGYVPPCEVVEGPVRLADHAGLVRMTVLTSGAVLEHEEHGAIVLDAGTYKLPGQREFTPEAIRNVAD